MGAVNEDTSKISNKPEIIVVTTEPTAKRFVINSNGIGESIITELVLLLQKAWTFLTFRLAAL